MLIALIVVALLAIGLLAMLMMTRSSAAEFRAQAEARESALISERDTLTEANGVLGREGVANRAEIDQLKDEAGRQAGEIRRLGGEIEQAAAAAAELRARIESQSAEITALVTDNNAMHEKVAAAEQARAAAEASAEQTKAEAEAIVAAAEARNTGVVIGTVAETDGADPAALWELEMARSERTWRTSVAVDPSSPFSPFETAEDPVRLAVEVQAAALREDVGASIVVDWQAALIDAPARRHLVLRVAQEMLEAAARTPEPLRLVALGEAGGDVVLRLEPAAADDGVIKIPQPRLTEDLVVVTEGTGLSVTVDAD